jgi:hypothetical protein
VRATPVLGGLSRSERHSAAFGAPGVAPTFCRATMNAFSTLIANNYAGIVGAKSAGWGQSTRCIGLPRNHSVPLLFH